MCFNGMKKLSDGLSAFGWVFKFVLDLLDVTTRRFCICVGKDVPCVLSSTCTGNERNDGGRERADYGI